MKDTPEKPKANADAQLGETSSPMFSGDFSRNEVQLDLDRFLGLMQENSALKDKIRELEYEDKVNPWQKWVHFAQTLDAWRIIPRAFLTIYMYLLYSTVKWFMALPAPTMEQSGLISIIVGAGAAWFGLYVSTKGDGNSSK